MSLKPRNSQKRGRNGNVISITADVDNILVDLQLFLKLSSRSKVIKFLLNHFNETTKGELFNFINERDKLNEKYMRRIMNEQIERNIL